MVLCSALFSCADSLVCWIVIWLLMSCWKMRSVIGVATTTEITAASASRGSAISRSFFQSLVWPMLSTRKRSMFKIMKPQAMPPIIATESGVCTPSFKANIIDSVPIPDVVSSTSAIWTNRLRSVGTLSRMSLLAPPSQANPAAIPLCLLTSPHPPR